ncbi:MAG: folate family ECF transporter S component [Oscillospiraceae bacterium]|jgi:ECF transporter S component (folate family)|nr:folate family ECF transporter S component [Oscillospiraceae bacterium]
MKLSEIFKNSAKELKNTRSLAVTGLLVAVYVVLNTFVAVNTMGLKITFGYLALASIAMLYGPVAAMVAAVPCDLITAMAVGLGINLVFTPIQMLEALIYGMLLYDLRFWGRTRLNVFQTIKIILARVLVVALCHMILNTTVLYYMLGVSSNSFFVFFSGRLTKNLAQFPVDIILMALLLPAVKLAFDKTGITGRGRKS